MEASGGRSLLSTATRMQSVCILYCVQHLDEALFHGKKISLAAKHLPPSVHRIASTKFIGGLLFLWMGMLKEGLLGICSSCYHP